ncbi:MAG: hypothetical protein C4297_03080 [Gemmataceae bacterium]
MAHCLPPDPVKYLVAVLWADAGCRDEAMRLMESVWGSVDYVSADRLFDVTTYYRAEMGTTLYRRLIAFATLYSPVHLLAAKYFTCRLEQLLARSAGRTVNLDIGYLDHNKVVLASLKPAGQKIYLGAGIYADLIARYKAGTYRPMEWAFLDFKDGRYDADLLAIRQLYLRQLRQWRCAAPPDSQAAAVESQARLLAALYPPEGPCPRPVF